MFKMMVVFSSIFVADIKIIYDYNFVASLSNFSYSDRFQGKQLKISPDLQNEHQSRV